MNELLNKPRQNIIHAKRSDDGRMREAAQGALRVPSARCLGSGAGVCVPPPESRAGRVFGGGGRVRRRRRRYAVCVQPVEPHLNDRSASKLSSPSPFVSLPIPHRELPFCHHRFL
ncbi:hypothetical protein OWV82_022571 [Melia azedarach]|uniref:Uncharacterized protein n=1 Tax=Melia azedarach TaxID=155640 RepID=A0ACC1WTZ8_MELAZ|nr:hypothetical protein OWV82_022571 [Melia azedarach]